MDAGDAAKLVLAVASGANPTRAPENARLYWSARRVDAESAQGDVPHPLAAAVAAETTLGAALTRLFEMSLPDEVDVRVDLARPLVWASIEVSDPARPQSRWRAEYRNEKRSASAPDADLTDHCDLMLLGPTALRTVGLALSAGWPLPAAEEAAGRA